MKNMYRRTRPSEAHDLVVRGRSYKLVDSIPEWKNAHPTAQWKPDHSAQALAYCWHESDSWPAAVAALWQTSPVEALKRITPQFGVVEHIVPLKGEGRGATNDLFILARTSGEMPVSITVEGKAGELFGSSQTIEAWKNAGISEAARNNRQVRLNGLCTDLGLLPDSCVDPINYQIFQRAASAMKEAVAHNAPYAVMFVHSFRGSRKYAQTEIPNWKAFADFTALYGKKSERHQLIELSMINGVRLFTAWLEEDIHALARSPR